MENETNLENKEKKALLLYNGPGAYAFFEWGKGKFEVPADNLERVLVDGRKDLVKWVHDLVTLEETEKRLKERRYVAIILGRKHSRLFDQYDKKLVWYHPPLGLPAEYISGDRSEGETILRRIRDGAYGKLNQNTLVYAIDHEFGADDWISRKYLRGVRDECAPNNKKDFEEGGIFNDLMKSLS